MITVLVTHGKHESVDYAFIMIFDTLIEANSYVEGIRTGKCKYWTDAEILTPGEEIELMQPD